MTRTAYVLLLSLGLAACVSVHVSTLSTFASADGRFSVTVPGGAMTDTILPSGGAFAGSTVHALSTTLPDGPRFAVIYGDADPSYLASTTVDSALAEAARANIDTTGGTLVDEHATTVAGLPGLEQRIAAGPVEYVFRFVFVGNRLYSVSVTGSKLQVDGADAKLFLDSFEVDR
jgi:hypothetical protein